MYGVNFVAICSIALNCIDSSLVLTISSSCLSLYYLVQRGLMFSVESQLTCLVSHGSNGNLVIC